METTAEQQASKTAQVKHGNLQFKNKLNKGNQCRVPFLEVRIAAEASNFQEGFHDKEPDKIH